MTINLNEHAYNNVTAALPGDFAPLPPGGYVCQIINAELATSKAGNLMLVLFLDIAEGTFQGYFKIATDIIKKYDSTKKWASTGIYRQLLFDSSDRVARFFKGLLSCIELSNPSFHVNTNNFDPASLRGLLCGFIFAPEEYQRRDGSLAQHVTIKSPKSVDDIRRGDFKIPDIKPPVPINSTNTLKNAPDSFSDTDTLDVPF